MSLQEPFQRLLAAIPPSFILILALPTLILLTTYLYTSIQYRLTLSKLSLIPTPSSKPESPPRVPYFIPILGHALSFLAPYPGLFWDRLFAKHPRSTGSCTLLLGGQQAHVLFDPSAVQALFKARGPTRDRFNFQVWENSMGLSHSEVLHFYGVGEATTDKTDHDPRFTTVEDQWDYMLRTERVNELTETFMRNLGDELEGDVRLNDGKQLETGLATWLKDHMFKASTYAFMGKRILEVYPELTQDFWEFEKAMVPLLFGLPKLMLAKELKARDTAVSGLQRWHEVVWEECKGQPIDPEDVSWEPIYGSRLNRARQRFYMYKELNSKAKAACDLGMMFGISSNAIPASCWMLLHILNPNGDKTLLPRVLKELETARSSDGINVPALVSLPLFQSILQEILRLYTDVLVTRDVHSDLILPLDDGERKLKFRKGDLLMAPSWLGHRDSELWNNPPPDVFYADRFLKQDPNTGEDVFTMTGMAGKFFPFGGGKTICPGRVFAKQEVMAAVATVLLNFDIKPAGFVDGQGRETDSFPGLAKSFQGTGVMMMQGDMRVRMRRRS
jgi:cytochrome P450